MKKNKKKKTTQKYIESENANIDEMHKTVS